MEFEQPRQIHRYELHERIDVGGMAEVFRATASSGLGLQKTVAIKRLLPHIAADPKLIAMFRDEARLALTLNHPNIAQTLDVGVFDGAYFMAMEWVDGWSLRRLLSRCVETQRQVPLEVACWITAQVADALDCIHSARSSDGGRLGAIHRDISPPNVLLTRAGHVKLIDFGLCKSRLNQAVTDPGIVKGKFAYLCPQAAMGLTVDHRTDIFALGICFWEMLACRRLFWSEQDAATVERVRAAEIPSLVPLHPAVTSELEGLIHKALAREPERRFQTANELAESIRAYARQHRLRCDAADAASWTDELFAQSATEQVDLPAYLRRRLDEVAHRVPHGPMKSAEHLAAPETHWASTAQVTPEHVERLMAVLHTRVLQK
jgi:serine/threonine-protein kinase